jgi:hypothetical protein
MFDFARPVIGLAASWIVFASVALRHMEEPLRRDGTWMNTAGYKVKHTREVVVALAQKDQLASLCVREGERCLNYQVLSTARPEGRMPLSKV